jgi:hypothetical protein
MSPPRCDHDDTDDGRRRARRTVRPLDAAAIKRLAPELPAGPRDGSTVLALDLGQHCGWALRGADGLITSGTAEFKPGRFEGGGMPYLRFRSWLQELHERVEGLGRILFEEVRAHRGAAAAHAYGGFLAHLTAWCEDRGVPYQGVPVGTIKRHVTGKGNAAKAAVIAAVRALGFAPADDNEADALALLHWALAQGGRR